MIELTHTLLLVAIQGTMRALVLLNAQVAGLNAHVLDAFQADALLVLVPTIIYRC